MLADAAVVLLHVGDKAEYDAEHLPGARHIETRALAATTQPGALTLQLPTPADLETKLEALGVSDTSRIVVYMGKDWISPLTRVVFTLDYAGLGGRTMVLDGGMPAWKAAGKAVTRDTPAAPTAGALTLKTRPEAVADLRVGAVARRQGRQRRHRRSQHAVLHRREQQQRPDSAAGPRGWRGERAVRHVGPRGRHLQAARGTRGDAEGGWRQARRDDHHLLSYRPAGHRPVLRGPHARLRREAVRRLVRRVGTTESAPVKTVARLSNAYAACQRQRLTRRV